MGNRAIITTPSKNVSVYLHWNGGLDSVEAFLAYCKLKGYRSPCNDSYGFARLCQVIGNFFGGGFSIGIEKYRPSDLEIGDNGVYVVKDWEIISREGQSVWSREGYNHTELLQEIDESQPVKEQLGKDFFSSSEVEVNALQIGDKVLYYDSLNGHYIKHEIVGIGEDKIVNGRNVRGIPYINKYGKSPEDNANNYLRTKKIRMIKES